MAIDFDQLESLLALLKTAGVVKYEYCGASGDFTVEFPPPAPPVQVLKVDPAALAGSKSLVAGRETQRTDYDALFNGAAPKFPSARTE